MTRRKYIKMVRALCEKISYTCEGKHCDGTELKHYRDLNINKIKPNSYAEAWESLKPARDLVGM